MARFKVIWTCENFDEYSSERRGANDDVEEHDWIVRMPQRRRDLQMQGFRKSGNGASHAQVPEYNVSEW